MTKSNDITDQEIEKLNDEARNRVIEENDEIGHELKASEIKVGMVVVISPPGQAILCTMDVEEVRDNLIVFGAPAINWHVINIVSNDGTIVDDRGRVVRVFKYLGA